MKYCDRYNLTQKQSIFLAKRFIQESVYNGVKLENCPLTFPETQAILDGINVPSATIDDIQLILNMRDAWKYVIQTINEPFTLEYICKVNSYVARNESLEWGVLRTGRVGISGVDYTPPIPEESSVREHIKNKINVRDRSVTERALDYFSWGAKQQLFWDGNKRTSLICANKILLQEGKGLLSIPERKMPQFNQLLSSYYEETSGNEHISNLKSFLYSECIKGIELENTPAINLVEDIQP